MAQTVFIPLNIIGSSFYTPNSWIANLSFFEKTSKSGRSTAKPIQGCICFFPDWILKTKMLQLIITMTFNPIWIFLR
ncbi:hypothetical protein RUMTOR_02893 [[Ruminococcus] torques ATCC 27756]|uniref:Uncharacterized protein n=1 Tax=[Ruminococcus] torques ATCC 27756 TaxID=411460 RepID=A5KRJ8_9FIRM|nr:hypothetical protein RUMTOR_02893 [[Ruminococcus] torques ATCC 27756]